MPESLLPLSNSPSTTDCIVESDHPAIGWNVDISGGSEAELAVLVWVVFSAILCYLATSIILKQPDLRARLTRLGIFAPVILGMLTFGSFLQRDMATILYLSRYPEVSSVGIWYGFSPIFGLLTGGYAVLIRLLVQAAHAHPRRQIIIRASALALFVVFLFYRFSASLFFMEECMP